MTSYGDQRRAAAAHKDLSRLLGDPTSVGLVLIDDDGRELPMVKGQVIRVGADSVVFRHDGVDEEFSLATISKRVHGDSTVAY
jgi:hypothetical protein